MKLIEEIIDVIKQCDKIDKASTSQFPMSYKVEALKAKAAALHAWAIIYHRSPMTMGEVKKP